ncbi:MAG: hypothetical protein WA840_19660 [Caulobacteraceae bacterium]
MSADDLGPDRKRKPQIIEGQSSVVRGPWEDLPKASKPPREPIFKRNAAQGAGRGLARGPAQKRTRGGGREPLINSWRGLVICLFLLFVAPPLAAFVGHFLMRTLFGSQGF